MKNSFRIIMALVTYFDLELHQMDIKTVFFKWWLWGRNLYGATKQFWGQRFIIFGLQIEEIHLWSNASIPSIVFEIWSSNIRFSFKEIADDQCIYHKFKESRLIFLVLYADDILQVSNDMSLLLETKSFLLKNFEMKDLGDISFVIGIQIQHNRRCEILDLS